MLNDDEWEVLTKGLSHRGGGAGSRQGQSAGLRKNGPCVRQGADGVVKVSVHCSLEMFLNIKTAAQLGQKAAVPLGFFYADRRFYPVCSETYVLHPVFPVLTP